MNNSCIGHEDGPKCQQAQGFCFGFSFYIQFKIYSYQFKDLIHTNIILLNEKKNIILEV